MEKAKVLGIVGSPRKNGNTAKLVKKALEGAMSVPGIETEFYEMAGKKFHHCIGCYRCLDTGACRFKDDFQDFVRRYMEADGIIWGAPVYHMSIPASMKCAIDRLGNSTLCNFMKRGLEIPRFNKVCGALTVGYHRYGGEDLTIQFFVNSILVMNGVAVAGDTLLGNYMGAVAPHTGPAIEALRSKDAVLQSEEGIACVTNLGKRVAEMTKIVKTGMSALKDELPSEYFYTWEEL